MGFFCGMKFDIISIMKSNAKNTMLLLSLIALINCKSLESRVVESQKPIQIINPYFKPWVSGVRGGGSGITVFLPVQNLNGITPDSIHFRGQRVKAFYENNTIIGRFQTPHNQPQEVILSNESMAEVKNQLLPKYQPSQFDLKLNDCVLSYIKQNKRGYYKIENLKQHISTPYPSASPKP